MNLIDFIQESNRIEGTLTYPSDTEIEAYVTFLSLKDVPTIQDLRRFVEVIQPDAQFRNMVSVPNVRVGRHIAPTSGPDIRSALFKILCYASGYGPYRTHCEYLTLHPFTDGNGRSARVLWLWMMGGAPRGFLHQFYYQSLDASDGRK